MRLLKLFIGVIIPHVIQAQEFRLADPGLKVYTDKYVYTLGEKIWFSAILTKATMADTAYPYHTLYLALINPTNKSVIKSARYVINTGCASGTMELPDSAGGKELVLIGYTNNLARNTSELPFIQSMSVNVPLRHVAHQQLKTPAHSIINLTSRLICDSVNYSKRSKVICRLSITDSLNKPLRGIFSFTCARDRVVPVIVNNYNDNNILTLDAETRSQINNGQTDLWLPNKGSVQLYDKAIKKSTKIIYNYDNRIHVIETAPNGSFVIDYKYFCGSDSTVAYFSPTGNIEQNALKVIFPHGEDRVNALIAALPSLSMQPVLTERTREVLDSGLLFDNIKSLKEVKVTGRDFSSQEYLSPVVDTSCEAYVCINRIINCPGHQCITKAEKGQYYYKHLVPNGHLVTVKYIGCNGVTTKRSKEVRLIQLPEPYIGLDSVSISSPESFKSTTVFWSPLIVTDDNGEAEVTFYTNDLPGNFICTVRGLSTLGEFKAQTMFTVKME